MAIAAEAAPARPAAGDGDRPASGQIEIVPARGRRLIVSEGVDAAALARIVAAVEGA